MKPEPLASQFDFLPGERQDMEFFGRDILYLPNGGRGGG